MAFLIAPSKTWEHRHTLFTNISITSVCQGGISLSSSTHCLKQNILEFVHTGQSWKRPSKEVTKNRTQTWGLREQLLHSDWVSLVRVCKGISISLQKTKQGAVLDLMHLYIHILGLAWHKQSQQQMTFLLKEPIPLQAIFSELQPAFYQYCCVSNHTENQTAIAPH